MYSLFDYMLSPPMRTVVVVSEDQLKDLKKKQYDEEIKTIEAQKGELEAAYNRRKQSLADSLAHLKSKVKALEPAKTTGRKKVGSTSN
tara:strand:+ start:755 stop:1018 length:264 start_codon:yes stop_codon:yes gene_type:complete